MKVTAKIVVLYSVILAAMAMSAQAAQTMTADEAKIAATLDDQNMSPEEEKAAVELMKAGGYFGMKIKLSYTTDKQTASRIIYAGSIPDRMTGLTNPTDVYYSKNFELAGVRVWLWQDPKAEVNKSAQAISKEVIAKIYADIVAIKDQYPELAMFDKEHVRQTDGSIYYSPSKPDRSMMIPSPTINLGFSEPTPGMSLQFDYFRELFPAQKLELHRINVAEDEELSKRLKDIIARDIEPMIQAEVALGSYPIEIGHGL